MDRSRWEWGAVLGLLLVLAISFSIFYPRTITIIDEMSYVRQAQQLVEGVHSEQVIHPITGKWVARWDEVDIVYPLGTALTLAPWIALGGWPLAFIAPLFSLMAGVLITARWIYEEGRSPMAALIILGFPPALVLARVCISGAPSLLIVSAALWLFWRGLDGHRIPVWLAAGFLAGASILFRETNILLFVFFFLGTLLRRDRGTWALVVGGAVGVSLRLLSSQLSWGDAFYYRPLAYAFHSSVLAANIPLYALALLVFVPGGLIAVFLYSGRRRAELVATCTLFLTFYLLYGYSGEESGWQKRLVLGPRFFLPLLPLLAFALADVVPRLWAGLGERLGDRHRRVLRRIGTVTLVLWTVGLAVESLAVNWVHSEWSSRQADIRELIYENTLEGSILVSNERATGKFINPLFGDRVHIGLKSLSMTEARQILQRNAAFYLVLLDRSDSEYWRRSARDNDAFFRTFSPRPELITDLTITPTDRLRIWRVTEISTP